MQNVYKFESQRIQLIPFEVIHSAVEAAAETVGVKEFVFSLTSAAETARNAELQAA